MKNEEIRNIIFYSGDLGKDVTVSQYFQAIIEALWEEGESFSGKRPLGNSGWTADIIAGLIKEGLVKGKLNEDGYIDDVDWTEAEDYVLKTVIPAVFKV